ncbi:MAG: arylsulfatase [Armatimonadota bacterium]
MLNTFRMDNRPNIILIITDQQRGDCLGIEGHPVLLTPNMDSIAWQGARFSRAYTTCPSCIAARRSILSGQHPSTHGMVGYQDRVEWQAPPTLPGVLREAGYQTIHVGRSMHQYPVQKRYGYDYIVPHDHLLRSEYDEWLDAQGQAGSGGMYGGGLSHNDWTARPWHLEERLHPTNWTVNEALRLMERRDPSCPLFMTISFLAPHPPLQPPAFYLERYLRTGAPAPVIGDWAAAPENDGRGVPVDASRINPTGEALLAMRAGYYGLINHIDDQLRRLLDPGYGVRKLTGSDTVFIFTSDHGEMLGDHHMFRKIVPYESSTRIPLLIQAPGHYGITPRTVIDQPACLEDLMPTILDMADVPIPTTVEGRSLLPLLRGETPPWREYLHIEHAPLQHTLTDGREKYIWFVPEHGEHSQWFIPEGGEQFFDLSADPQECHDLINDPGAQQRIAHWRARMVEELRDRPEGFSDGERLNRGRPYAAVLERE